MPNVAVKISKDLAEAARVEALAADRSMAGQIEHWGKLGKAVENLFTAQEVSALKAANGDLAKAFPREEERQAAAHLLARLREELPTQRLSKRLQTNQAAPLYEAHSANPDLIVQVHPDGTRVSGKFVGGAFVAEESADLAEANQSQQEAA